MGSLTVTKGSAILTKSFMVGWPSFVSPHQDWSTQEWCTDPHLILSQGSGRVLGTQLVSFTDVKTEIR